MLESGKGPGHIGGEYLPCRYPRESHGTTPYQQVGDELAATVEVERASGRKLSFSTAVKNAAGKVLVSGNAMALLRA